MGVDDEVAKDPRQGEALGLLKGDAQTPRPARTPPVFKVGLELYRLVDTLEADYSFGYHGELEWGQTYSTRVRLEVWTVDKVTPCGAWVALGRAGDQIRGEAKWVTPRSRLLFVSPAEAREGAIAKRRWHIEKTRQRLRQAERRLQALEQWSSDEGGEVTRS